MKYYTSNWELRRGEKGEIVNEVLEKLQPGDCLYHLGDFAESKDVLEANMDLLEKGALEKGFKMTLIIGEMDRKFFKFLLKRYSAPIEGFKWFYLKTIHVERLAGKKMTLTHYPLVSFDESDRNGYHLHGHLWGMEQPLGGKRLDVSGKLWSEKELEREFKKKGDNWDFRRV